MLLLVMKQTESINSQLGIDKNRDIDDSTFLQLMKTNCAR